MTKIPMPNNIVRPRVEPTFEGDRKWRELRNVEAQEAAEEVEHLVDRTGGPSDYAQPDVRKLANLEEEIGKLAQQEAIPELKRSRDIGNSHDMKKVQHMVKNSITAAHEDTCKALDKFVAEIRKMADQAEKDVEEYKTEFQSNGQEIAMRMEARMQTVAHTVETIEKLTAALRNPKLDPPVESVPPITETDVPKE